MSSVVRQHKETEMSKAQILSYLSLLIGKQLSIARRAASMRGFHFGRITIEADKNRSTGEFALHIQCPWRIEGPIGIVTGDEDLWEPVGQDEDIDWEKWNYEDNENLQDQQVGELLGGYDPMTKSFINKTEFLVVEAINADDFGGASISLSGNYRLVLFPSSSVSENWRLFQPSSDQEHFVIAGGLVESADDAG